MLVELQPDGRNKLPAARLENLITYTTIAAVSAPRPERRSPDAFPSAGGSCGECHRGLALELQSGGPPRSLRTVGRV